MGMIQRNLENAAMLREQGDLGGILTFAGNEYPCSMGGDTYSLGMKPDGGGFQASAIRRVVVRSALLDCLDRPPRSNDVCILKCNLEKTGVRRTISPTNGVEKFNAILTAINFQDEFQKA